MPVNHLWAVVVWGYDSSMARYFQDWQQERRE
jgi:hypothetical protein